MGRDAAADSLAGDTASVVASQAVVMVAGLAGSIITARVLGPSGRGVLSLVTLWVLLLAIAAPLSCGYGLIYHLRNSSTDFPQALSTALGLSLGFGAMAVGVSLLGGHLLRHSLLRGVPFSYLLLVSLALPAAIFVGVSGLALIGAGRVKQVSTLTAVNSGLGLGLLCLFLFALRLGLLGAVIASAITSVLGAAIAIAWLWPHLRWRRLMRAGHWSSVVCFGLKTHGGAVAQLANYSLDRFLINLYLGPTAVGIYSIAGLLAERLWVLPGAVQTALYPRTGGEARDDGELTAAACRKALWLMAGACLAVAAAGPWLISALFGPDFSGAARPLLILLPGVLFLSAGKVMVPYIQNRGRPLMVTYVPLGSLVLTLSFNLLLIPRWGISGSAAASTLAYAAYGIALTAVFVRLSKRRVVDLIRFPFSDLMAARRLRLRLQARRRAPTSQAEPAPIRGK